MFRRNRLRLYYEINPIPFGELADIIGLQLGYALIPLVNKEEKSRPKGLKKDVPLLKEITACRNYFSAEYGIHLPAVHISDNACLHPDEYAIYMNGIECARGHVRMNCVFCWETDDDIQKINTKAKKVKYPELDIEGYWIPESETKTFVEAGYSTLFPEEIIRIQLVEIIKKNITQILNQNLVNQLVIKVRKVNPDVVDDLFFTKQYTTSELKILLNTLLGSGFSIRDMNTILETIADWLNVCRDNEFIFEKVKEKFLDMQKSEIRWEKKHNEST